MSTTPAPGQKPGTPRSAFDQVNGLTYFARMLDKIRLHAKGELHTDYHPNLGKGGDGWICHFLRVDYPAVVARVKEGGTDEEILAWCAEQGRPINDVDLHIWNNFGTKLGWNDRATPHLQKFKRQSGLGDRDDLQTFWDYFDVDEGRKA